MPSIIVTTSSGLEEILADEIRRVCSVQTNIQVKPGQCRFDADLLCAYQLCIQSRLANRVLLVLASGKAGSADELYDTTSLVDWPQIFDGHCSFAIQAKGQNRTLKNTAFIAMRVKDAIVDAFEAEELLRPNVDKQCPDILFQARVFRDNVDICLDMSGTSLHQRGYRQDTGIAPLKEHLVVAMLLRSGWTPQSELTLVDPMCGSGTIAIEAAQMLTNTPPNLLRTRWGFEHYHGHNESLWQSVIQQANEAISVTDKVIFASDMSMKLIEIARENAKNAGVEHIVEFKQMDVLQSRAPTDKGVIVSNPPYGERLGEYVSMLPFYDELGKHVKEHFAGWQLALLCSEKNLLKALRLRAHKRHKMYNGKLECEFVVYDLNDENLNDFSQLLEDNEFVNRFKKNVNKLSKWAKQKGIEAYRLYDADLPNYNFAIDLYGDYAILQEYKAPKNIPKELARKRLDTAIISIPKILNIPTHKLVVKLREVQQGNTQYQKMGDRNKRFQVVEHGAKFWINPHDYLDVGLFLDHRQTRQMFASECRGKDVLNLFCYTGSVSVHAALNGARSVTSVDMSKTYIQWAKDNSTLNNIKVAMQFVQSDCTSWLSQQSSLSNVKYDCIFIDPPSFSNSKRMEDTFDVQRDHVKLLAQAASLLNPDGLIYFSNNLRTFKLNEVEVQNLGLRIDNISKQTLPQDYIRNPKIHQCWKLTHAN